MYICIITFEADKVQKNYDGKDNANDDDQVRQANDDLDNDGDSDGDVEVDSDGDGSINGNDNGHADGIADADC